MFRAGLGLDETRHASQYPTVPCLSFTQRWRKAMSIEFTSSHPPLWLYMRLRHVACAIPAVAWLSSPPAGVIRGFPISEQPWDQRHGTANNWHKVSSQDSQRASQPALHVAGLELCRLGEKCWLSDVPARPTRSPTPSRSLKHTSRLVLSLAEAHPGDSIFLCCSSFHY